ncbi:uncharacterized protein LOC143035317 [Oratosquilla oratoria]|uniref:uncharacterized protein LOC143035317 n=1 Tax=Oratosquilla oratoria TaxID=337810 RepID=UPI003F7618DF
MSLGKSIAMEASNNEDEVPEVVIVEKDLESCSDDDVIEGGSSSSDDVIEGGSSSSDDENYCSPPASNDVNVLLKSTSSGSPKKNQNNKKKTWQNRNGENSKNTNKGASRNNFNQGVSKPNNGYGKSGNDNQSSSKISSNSRGKNESGHGYTPNKSKGNNNYSPTKSNQSYNQGKIMDNDNCTPNKKEGGHPYSPYKSKGDHNHSPDKNKGEHNNPGHVSAGNSPNSVKSDTKNGNSASNDKKKNNNPPNNGNKKNTNENSAKVKVTTLQQLQCFAPWVFKRKENHSPFNTAVMQLHTRWTVWFFFQIAMIVWSNWYWQEGLIMCINQMDAKKAADHYLNICLSYIFTSLTDKKYLMHYRWIHWMFGLLAFAYFILKIVTVVLDNARVKKFLEDVARSSERYDKNSVEQTKQTVVAYFQLHAGHHQGLYMKLIFVHLLAYLLDLAVIAFINFTIQGQFMYLVPDALPFSRDYVGFTDPLSTVFPPFASCTFNKDWRMFGSRTEEFVCHLTLMELYEKIFVFVWLWMVLLVVWSSIYVVFLMVAIVSPIWTYIHHVVALKHIQRSVSKTWGLADFYVLFCVKRRVSAVAFVQITEELGIASNPGCKDVEQGANRRNYYHSWKPCPSDMTKNETELGHLDYVDFCEQVLSGGNDVGNQLHRRQKKYVGPRDMIDSEL